jgi:hypothetical protein
MTRTPARPLLTLTALLPLWGAAVAGPAVPSGKGTAASKVVASVSESRTVTSPDGRGSGKVTFTLQIVRDGANAYATTRVAYDVPRVAFGTGFSHLLPALKSDRPLSMSNPRQTLAFPLDAARPVLKTAWRSPDLMAGTAVPAQLCAAAQLNLQFNGPFPFAPTATDDGPAMKPAVIELQVCETRKG